MKRRPRKIWVDENMALDLLDRPAAMRKEGEVERLTKILEEIDRPSRQALPVEMLASEDSRRGRGTR